MLADLDLDCVVVAVAFVIVIVVEVVFVVAADKANRNHSVTYSSVVTANHFDYTNFGAITDWAVVVAAAVVVAVVVELSSYRSR